MGNVLLFSFPPWRLWFLICIAASIDNSCDVLAEVLPDFPQTRCAAAIFDHIMKKRANRFSFISPIFQRNGGNSEKMRYVGNAAAFFYLITVGLAGVDQRLCESRR